MTNRILSIIMLFTVIGAGIGIGRSYAHNRSDEHEYSYAGLTVNWGPGNTDRLFVVSNMLPGDTVTKTAKVKNGSPYARLVTIWTKETSPPTIFPDVLDIVISQNSTDLYGGNSATGRKTLRQFFIDSQSPLGVPLSTVSKDKTVSYKFRVHFPSGSGNEYQKLKVVFSIIFGVKMKIPNECSEMKFDGPPIFGTHNNDRINGTDGNDLIFGLEGNDRIDGHHGDDCIIGGDGDDDIHGGHGHDRITGDHGNDKLYGDEDDDSVDGNDGRNSCDGERKWNCQRS